MSSSVASAIWNPTTDFPTRARRRTPSAISVRIATTAGARPNRTPVAIEISAVKANTCQSKRGVNCATALRPT